MFLDYSKLEFDLYGRPEVPVLALQTLGGKTICTIPSVFDIKLNIKFSEPSEISFKVASKLDGSQPNPFYHAVTGHKLIYTKQYGVFVIMNPTTISDGISDIKEVTGYSLEKTLDSKQFFMEEGTFNFWNPASAQDTVLGRVLELAKGWTAGYVSPKLIGRYRTFDTNEERLLSFMYNTAPEKFRCVFVFDPYAMSINVYDIDEDRPTLPIYLDFENLLQEINVVEMSDELATAIRPFGADDLDIREVNPIGTNWLYDLSYFISNGDIESALAHKWNAWKRSILNKQTLYKGLIGLRASTTGRLLVAQSTLADLENELKDLTNQQSITIQALAMETTTEGKAVQQKLLDEINGKITIKKAEILEKNKEIETIKESLDATVPHSYNGQIQAIIDELALGNYFTEDEQNILSPYFIEQDITESTFIATSVSSDTSGSSQPFQNGTIKIEGASILEVDFTTAFKKRMFTIAGGTFSLANGANTRGDIIRGTLEINNNSTCVMSLYMGKIVTEKETAPSGIITITGTVSSFSSDVKSVTEDEIASMIGTKLQLEITSASMYLTQNVTDYQKYSVQMELFDFASETLHDLATPTYEFTVNSGNFIFAQEFRPFRKSLELGRGVYLRTGEDSVIKPIIIEFELDFENRENFSIIFSNRFKRHDNVNLFSKMISSGYSASKSIDASKYIYNQTAGQACAVSEFMNGSLDAATNTIIGAANQSVVINGSGIQVGGDSKYQMRIVDSMIAMTDDNWETSKMAIGRFASPELGAYWGVNGEVIGGKLFVGNNLIIENQNDEGVMQFKVDSSGAWLNNSTLVIQNDTGKILIDPNTGLSAGTGALYTTEGTTVMPSFIDDKGNIILDGDGMPENANFHISLKDGKAYFRGTVHATDGVFTGKVYATDGEFSGTLKATTLDGELKGGTNGGAIKGVSLDIGDGNFAVDQQGNVTMAGDINLSDGAISWGGNIPNKKRYAVSKNGPWHDTFRDGDIYCCDWNYQSNTWDAPRKFIGQDGVDGSDANVPGYIKRTHIDATGIETFHIKANKIEAVCPSGSQGDEELGFILTGEFDNRSLRYLRIYSYAGLPPTVVFTSPQSCAAEFDFPNISMRATTLDFTNIQNIEWGDNAPHAVFL